MDRSLWPSELISSFLHGFMGHSNSPKVGQVAYRLEFPPQSRLHVFHVSFLKPKLGANVLLLVTLPLVDSKYTLYPETQAILQSRMKKLNNRFQLK